MKYIDLQVCESQIRSMLDRNNLCHPRWSSIRNEEVAREGGETPGCKAFIKALCFHSRTSLVGRLGTVRVWPLHRAGRHNFESHVGRCDHRCWSCWAERGRGTAAMQLSTWGSGQSNILHGCSMLRLVLLSSHWAPQACFCCLLPFEPCYVCV